ncbi:Bacteriocin-protection, YdeI or OmpD-Associated [Roseivivax lentus]|uniref:Bacteriocin-protection, YdeI or OmpD-Associated n=1 Tax=Roseivivax lentus TaxID=633194 RepID=A0A1N7NYY1_9RHOB|nr:YdeI/OmpD-associated family protein [Roseivivax lentus]SIT03557.1 Bacteriocin-protection, YdeI or OmpD-Associated [Roseivivax lentus]
MPDFVLQALEDHDLKTRYDQRPWYQRNDYLGWISRAKREETKMKRLNQMLDELRSGDAYMKMPWHARR